MSWEKERDALIARTMAFVNSVAGKKENANPAVRFDAARRHVDIAPVDIAPTAPLPPLRIAEPRISELRIAEPPVESPPAVIQLSRPKIPSDFQREIHDRIESFRKHQERFNRERAEYFNTTLARLRAALDEAAAQRIVK
jgi:hypothetical protein